MYKFIRVTMAVALASGLMASQAHAAALAITQQGSIATCVKTLQTNMTKNERTVLEIFGKCAQAQEKCLSKTTAALRAACYVASNAAGKACSAAALSTTDVTAKVGKAIDKMKTAIGKKCNTATVTLAKLTEANAMTIVNADNDLGTKEPVANGNYGANFGSFFYESGCVPANSAAIATCAATELLARVRSGLASMGPRYWSLMNVSGVSNTLNIGELGVHNASGVTTANVQLFLAGSFTALPVNPAFSTKIRIGSVDPVTDVAPITIAKADASFQSVIVSGNIVCVAQPGDGSGKLCCGANCSASGMPGGVNYTTVYEHDSSGNNAGPPFGLIGAAANTGALAAVPNNTAVFADDPTCAATQVNAHLGVQADATSLACSEAQARIGACNKDLIGTAGAGVGASHNPVCLDGARIGQQCQTSPVLTAVNSCGAGAVKGCGYPWPGCNPAGCPAVLPLAAPVCNSPVYLKSFGPTATNGDMAIKLPIQFTIYPVTVLPFRGVDGIPCTADDTAPPGTINAVIATTGTAQSFVIDQNAVPWAGGTNPLLGTPGLNQSAVATGAKTTCQAMAASVLTGIQTAGAFGAYDGALGDTTTTTTLSY